MDELQERFAEMEIRYTHQARLIEELNGEVLECSRRLDRLERDNRRMLEMLKSLSSVPAESPDE